MLDEDSDNNDLPSQASHNNLQGLIEQSAAYEEYEASLKQSSQNFSGVQLGSKAKIRAKYKFSVGLPVIASGFNASSNMEQGTDLQGTTKIKRNPRAMST